jgi:hypothetical protein
MVNISRTSSPYTKENQNGLYYPVSGGAQPVFATDVRNPVAANASTAATPVNFAGPKLDFYRVVANTTVAGQQDVNEYVSNVIQAIAKHMYSSNVSS